MAYELNNGNQWGRVANFTRIPRIMRDADGLWVDVEATIYDWHNYDDQKEMSVMLHIWGQIGRKSGKTKQDALCALDVAELRRKTGLRPATIAGKLRRLAERNMIGVREDRRGKTTRYHVHICLPLSDWKAKIHPADPDDIP